MKLIVPKLSDPRWPFLGMFFIYTTYTVLSNDFGRSFLQLFSVVVTVVTADYLVNFKVKKIKLLPLSGLITALGLSFLIFSSHVWPFCLVGLVASLSKNFLRLKGKHVFNPNNFGVIFGLTFLGDYISTNTGRWNNQYILLFSIILLGSLVSFRAKRLSLSLGFILMFFVGALLRSQFLEQNLEVILIPMTGPIFYVYSFFHITDPKTTPIPAKQQMLFAFAVVLADSLLRIYEFKFSLFYGLFIIHLLRALISNIDSRPQTVGAAV